LESGLKVVIFDSTPVGYSGAHLENLGKMYLERTCLPLEMILARIMIVGAAIRMIVDSLRFMSFALRDCWQNREITAHALHSFHQGLCHLVLAIFTSVLGILFPSLIIKIAYRIGILPHHCGLDTLGGTISTIAYGTFALIACFLVARTALALPQILKDHVQKLELTYGATNVRAAVVASAVMVCGSLLARLGWYAYTWSSLNGLWVCYKFIAFICLPRHFSF
jgi:hypothetical protein